MKKPVLIISVIIGGLLILTTLAGFTLLNFINGGDIIPGTNASSVSNISYTI